MRRAPAGTVAPYAYCADALRVFARTRATALGMSVLWLECTGQSHPICPYKETDSMDCRGFRIDGGEECFAPLAAVGAHTNLPTTKGLDLELDN